MAEYKKLDLRSDLLSNFDLDITDYKRRIYTKVTPDEISGSWENGFTDPKAHYGNKYRYLVHGLTSELGRIPQLIFMLKTKTIDNSQDIDLLKSPMRVSERRHVSCSVIDQSHTSTFTHAGLILSTVGENVLKVSPEDSGTVFFRPDTDKTLNRTDLCTVDELMNQTSPGDYNEVTLTGKTDQGETKVIGFWVKVDEQGLPLDVEVAKQVRIHAYRSGLPLVEIKEVVKGYDDDKPEIFETIGTGKPWGCAVNRGGLRYVFNFKNKEFLVLENMNKCRAMTKAEFDYAKTLFGSEFDKEQLAKIATLIANTDAF